MRVFVLWVCCITSLTLFRRFDVPATVPGRVVVAISNIFSVAVFAIPAGILASGFEPIGEEMIKSREKKLKERQSMLRRLNNRSKLERSALIEGGADISRDDTVSEETMLMGKPVGAGSESLTGDAEASVGTRRRGKLRRRAFPVHLTETPADSDEEEEDGDEESEDVEPSSEEEGTDDSDNEDLFFARRKVATTITVRRFAKRVGRVVQIDKKALMPFLLERLSKIFGVKVVALLDRHNGIVSELHHLLPSKLYVAVTEAELHALEAQT